MLALLTTDNPLRLFTTKLLSYLTPRAFVGPQAQMQLRDLPEPELPAEDWLIADTSPGAYTKVTAQSQQVVLHSRCRATNRNGF